MVKLQEPKYVYMGGDLRLRKEATLHVGCEAVTRNVNVFEGLKGYWSPAGSLRNPAAPPALRPSPAIHLVGCDPLARYAGGSAVVDPHGKVVAQGGRTEGIVRVDVNRRMLLEWREQFTVLRDMRMQLRLPQRATKRDR
jgi:hypothetical protein